MPHLLPVNNRVVTKYTSALNGDSNPYFQPWSRVSTGMLSVVSMCLPGANKSPNCPRYTNWTICDSRTMSWAPRLISLSSSGKRYDSVSRESSVHSMISMNWLLMKSINPMRVSPQVRLKPDTTTAGPAEAGHHDCYRKDRIVSYEIGARPVLALL